MPDDSSADSPRIVCVDLNGVLDTYTGWKGPDHWDPPRAGAREFLLALLEHGFRVVVFTTRHADGVWTWLRDHDLAELVADVTSCKPAAHVFIDDRALCFSGDFHETFAAVLSFAAHWEVPNSMSSR
jgi:hypothetical protein